MKALILALLLIPGFALADVSVPRAKQYAWTQYDVSRDGGSSTAHTIGLKLPTGAIITNVYLYIATQFASNGTESLGVSCVGNQDIMAYSSVKSISPGRVLAGGIGALDFNGGTAPLPASPNVLNLAQGFASIPSSCSVKFDVRGDSGYMPYTGGKGNLIVEYFLKN